MNGNLLKRRILLQKMLPWQQKICQQIPCVTFTMILVKTGTFIASILPSFHLPETFQRVKTWTIRNLSSWGKNKKQVESKKEMSEVGTCCGKASGRLTSAIVHVCVACVNGCLMSCDSMELLRWFTHKSSSLVGVGGHLTNDLTFLLWWKSIVEPSETKSPCHGYFQQNRWIKHKCQRNKGKAEAEAYSRIAYAD